MRSFPYEAAILVVGKEKRLERNHLFSSPYPAIEEVVYK